MRYIFMWQYEEIQKYYHARTLFPATDLVLQSSITLWKIWDKKQTRSDQTVRHRAKPTSQREVKRVKKFQAVGRMKEKGEAQNIAPTSQVECNSRALIVASFQINVEFPLYNWCLTSHHFFSDSSRKMG